MRRSEDPSRPPPPEVNPPSAEGKITWSLNFWRRRDMPPGFWEDVAAAADRVLFWIAAAMFVVGLILTVGDVTTLPPPYNRYALALDLVAIAYAVGLMLFAYLRPNRSRRLAGRLIWIYVQLQAFITGALAGWYGPIASSLLLLTNTLSLLAFVLFFPQPPAELVGWLLGFQTIFVLTAHLTGGFLGWGSIWTMSLLGSVMIIFVFHHLILATRIHNYRLRLRLAHLNAELLDYVKFLQRLLRHRHEKVSEAQQTIRQLEENVQRRQERLERILQHSFDAVLVVEEGEIVRASEWYKDSPVGRWARSLVGWSCAEFLQRAQPDGENLAELPLLAGRRIAQLELEGQPRWVEAIEAGTRSERLLILRDVTEEVHVQLRAVEQERLATLGQLMVGVVHDFNNVMQAIRSLVEGQLEGSERLPESTSHVLKAILAQLNVAYHISSQILDFAGESEARSAPIELRAFLAEVGEFLRHVLPDSIELVTHLPEEKVWVELDPTHLHQILINLAVNARDAMAGRGHLEIRVEPKGESVEIAVRDTGPGIPEEIRHRIFEPFFTTKGPRRGSGLGLSQVYGLTKRNNGEVSFDTGPEGTAFYLRFPRMPEPPRKRARGRRERQRRLEAGTRRALLKGIRVLWVEDDPTVRSAVAQVLANLGVEVTAKSNALDALAALEEDRIDVVFTDAQMPGLDGVAFARKVHERNGPPVILTGGIVDECWRQLIDEGVVAGILPKPFGMADLARMLLQVTRRGEEPRPTTEGSADPSNSERS